MSRKAAARVRPEPVERFLRATVPVGPVVARPMFGGHAFYLDGVVFALEADGEIWLKVDDRTRDRFAAAGSRPFVYDGRNRPVAMPYWIMPADAAKGGRAFRRWVDLALAAGRRASRAKRPAPPRARAPRDFI